MKSLPEQLRALAESYDKRQWKKAAELCDELEAETTEKVQQIIDSIEQLRVALDNKESAMEEPISDRADTLDISWDEVMGACAEIAEAFDWLVSA